jgi:hypothetical protein
MPSLRRAPLRGTGVGNGSDRDAPITVDSSRSDTPESPDERIERKHQLHRNFGTTRMFTAPVWSTSRRARRVPIRRSGPRSVRARPCAAERGRSGTSSSRGSARSERHDEAGAKQERPVLERGQRDGQGRTRPGESWRRDDKPSTKMIRSAMKTIHERAATKAMARTSFLSSRSDRARRRVPTSRR